MHQARFVRKWIKKQPTEWYCLQIIYLIRAEYPEYTTTTQRQTIHLKNGQRT